MNEMKHALRASVVIAIFGKAACKHGLCLIIRINKKNWNKNSEIRKSFSSFYFCRNRKHALYLPEGDWRKYPNIFSKTYVYMGE